MKSNTLRTMKIMYPFCNNLSTYWDDLEREAAACRLMATRSAKEHFETARDLGASGQLSQVEKSMYTQILLAFKALSPEDKQAAFDVFNLYRTLRKFSPNLKRV